MRYACYDVVVADTLQIRNVPSELHVVIAERARAQGLTISQYLLRRIAQIEGKPEIGEVLDAHWVRTRARRHSKPGVAAALLSEDRDR
jgi:ethanolamine ammonia-lyase small subunit